MCIDIDIDVGVDVDFEVIYKPLGPREGILEGPLVPAASFF